ncbi:hypothetical protein [Terriglobus roseus]|uniref:Adenylate cyclase n=1 Tax=Terriglobus roseus TaxID=392734 RepID=A0A1G7NXP9_9BACT|nr:hypothetical protein [Terriglobus roseus]SDF77980.1 hypothetical protein SAMN05444167_3288 [Terriglobus roseus]
MASSPTPHAIAALSAEEKDRVRAQLDRLLQSSHFRNSKRYPTLLGYIVEETLEGRGPQLKERTLGIDVFGRSSDYDTASDPIVRVTIAEIRKRIAQYYHEDAHASELRIELTPGSYIPEFLPGREHEPEVVSEPSSAPQIAPVVLETASAPPRRHWLLPVLAGVLVLLAGAGFAGWYRMRSTPMDDLWRPLFAADGPITYCLPMSVHRKGPGWANTTEQAVAHAMDLADTTLPASGTFFDHQVIGENVVFSDVIAMMKLESVVEQQHRPVRVRLNLGTNLNELREGPAIFIGGLSNQWTLKLIDPLRYRFAGSDEESYYIRDRQDPNNKQWSIRLRDKMTTINRDYAIIARVHCEPLGSVCLIAAGIGMSGTAAAGEFLANPEHVRELERRIGRANRDRDFEAVLTTSVEDGIAGPAEIVALDVR